MRTASRVSTITNELAVIVKDQPHLAKFIGELGRMSEGSLEAAASMYQSLELWGGPGSFADMGAVDLAPEQQNRFYELVVELFEQFEAAGIHHERAPFWVSAFRSWVQNSHAGDPEAV